MVLDSFKQNLYFLYLRVLIVYCKIFDMLIKDKYFNNNKLSRSLEMVFPLIEYCIFNGKQVNLRRLKKIRSCF